MKRNLIKSLLLGLAVLMTATGLFAHPGEHGQPPRPPQLPDAVPEILAAVDGQRQSMAKAMDEERLNRLAPHARTLNLLVQHLTTRVTEHHREKLKQLATEHDALTSALLKAASGGSKTEVSAILTKVFGSVDAINAEAH